MTPPDINVALKKLREKYDVCMECGYSMLDGETHAVESPAGVVCTLQPENYTKMPHIFFDHYDHSNLIRVVEKEAGR